MTNCATIYHLLVLLATIFIHELIAVSDGSDPMYMEPVQIHPLQYLPVVPEPAGTELGSRRQLAPFQLCLPCKCCTASPLGPACTTMPCCFGIDCQIPNKPYGFCAFVPKTCNCTSCPV